MRGLPWRSAALLAAVLTLAGCAGGAPAPVEDRSGASSPAAAAARHAAEGSTASAPGPGPSVTVRALPDSGPVRVDAPPDEAASARTGRGAPSAGANPAVVALLNRANGESGAGRHDAAAASLERAVKIEPGNAWLWHRLAAVRFDQGRPGDAASMAARSNALAAGDGELQARNWMLIARVHRQRGEEVAAREAERRARALSAPSS